MHELASGEGRSLLFMRTKHGAKKLARDLTLAGVPAVDLHGNLAQNARTRNLEAFRSGEVKVLVATDVAARGIHVDDIALVVHVDPPTEHKAYLHRSGRTARAGASGVVVTLQTSSQRGDVDADDAQGGHPPEPVVGAAGLARAARAHRPACRVRRARGPSRGAVVRRPFAQRRQRRWRPFAQRRRVAAQSALVLVVAEVVVGPGRAQLARRLVRRRCPAPLGVGVLGWRRSSQPLT